MISNLTTACTPFSTTSLTTNKTLGKVYILCFRQRCIILLGYLSTSFILLYRNNLRVFSWVSMISTFNAFLLTISSFSKSFLL